MKKEIESLVNEYEIMKELDHPNIVKYYEMYFDQSNYYFVMEHCNGGDLFDYIKDRYKKKDNGYRLGIDENKARSIVRQLLSALNHIHARNICHRDLKPENIMFEDKYNKNS